MTWERIFLEVVMLNFMSTWWFLNNFILQLLLHLLGYRLLARLKNAKLNILVLVKVRLWESKVIFRKSMDCMWWCSMDWCFQELSLFSFLLSIELIVQLLNIPVIGWRNPPRELTDLTLVLSFNLTQWSSDRPEFSLTWILKRYDCSWLT